MRSIRPRGVSIGRALDLPAGPLYDDLRETIAAIERVHGSVRLPRIPVRIVSHMTSLGRFRFDPVTGEPISIWLRPGSLHRSLTFLHEIGHFLDLTALGAGPVFGTLSNPAYANWTTAVVASRAYQLLGEIDRQQSALVHALDGTYRSVLLNERELVAIRDWMRPEEVWARSYAQYVALRSDHRDAIESLVSLRARDADKVYYPRQWDDEDFGPIGTAIDDLMVELGWRQ
jgi:hypothetical protein